MFILLHCAGMPFNGATIHERSLGGSETAAYYVAKGLAARGHKVTIFTNSPEEGKWDGVRYSYLGNVTEQFPLGDRFTYYGMNTPSDVLIMQRHPLAFRYKWASKINLWWLHDIALGRLKNEIAAMAWNIDGILSVSEWHKEQIVKGWGLPSDIVLPVTNGVDLSLWEQNPARELVQGSTKLLYAARPERGFIHLVAPDGIMERLLKKDSSVHLYYCSYENQVSHRSQEYSEMESMAQALPNCTNLGPLTKRELAAVEKSCDLYVYPTVFEDTSCIMAMECAAAGLPFVTSPTAAVPETSGKQGTVYVKLEDDRVDPEAWANNIQKLAKSSFRDRLSLEQLAKAPKYSWDKSVDAFLGHIQDIFSKNQANHLSMVRHFINMSDYYAAKKYHEEGTPESSDAEMGWVINEELAECWVINEELAECYRFAEERTWANHYRDYYQYEKDRGVEYGPENLENNPRYSTVANLVSDLPADSVVLDYGCAHGHYTNNLAKANPGIQFIGCDIAESNIAIAREWAEQDGLRNVEFICGESDEVVKLLSEKELTLDCVIAAEILEHVECPWDLMDELHDIAKKNAQFILTTPYGPWEESGYVKQHPWRAHVHHLERADLHELWGDNKDFKILCVPSGHNVRGEPVGSYITTFNSSVVSGRIDYQRKFDTTIPRQTISLCMIVKDGEETLKRSLEAVRPIVDEIIIGVDTSTTDRTKKVIQNFLEDTKLWPAVTMMDIPPAIETGFDEARNATLAKAKGDWILWIDNDELVVNGQNIYKYLRNNMYSGYAMKQHHFAVEPLGVMKTDIPARMFRNNIGVRFFGVVHEHPETELNKGIGVSMLIPDIEIAHEGYTTNTIRRKRFDRNIELMVRDRAKYPDRLLGKFLWIRDLSQMCTHEVQDFGPRITDDMVKRAEVGLKLWEELLDAGELRMLLDGLEFYSVLSSVNGAAFSMGFSLDLLPPHMTVNMENGVHRYEAKFASKDHANRLLRAIVEEKVKNHDQTYF